MAIQRVKIKNFKSLKSVDVPFSPLTVITGMNSSGKSTLIQALFVARETVLKNYPPIAFKPDNGHTKKADMVLDTEAGSIGSFQDVLSHDYEEDGRIVISLVFPQKQSFTIKTAPYNTQNKNDSKVSSTVEDSMTPPNLIFGVPDVYEEAIFNNNLKYLSAYRVGPTDRYPASATSHDNQLYKDGRFAASFLERFGDTFKVHEKICRPIPVTDGSNLLSLQMNAWLGYITSNENISIKVMSTSTSEVEMSYSFDYGRGIPSPFNTRPINVGFGISYIFPVLVAILSANPGDLLIIENPESDLHPKAQSRLGELLALASGTGIQIIVETHSEHIINGIRIQIKKHFDTMEQEGIPASDVAVHYFTRDLNNQTSIDTAYIENNAALSITRGVEGFFDQTEEDLLKIL